MENIFIILFLISPIGLVAGLIRPQIYSRFYKKELNRKKISIAFTSLFFASFVGLLFTADSPKSKPKVSTKTEIKQAASAPTTAPTKTPIPTPPPQKIATQTELFTVTRVIDGDTIEIEGGQRVWYIGIDTPELNQGECFAIEATNRNKDLLANTKVKLEKDVSETDRYGRLLKYVYTESGAFINDILVKDGYANASSYPPDVKHQSTFTQSQSNARSANKGLWGVCDQAVAAPTKLPTGSSTCKYDCNGSDKDCSDFSSHAEAQTFFECCGFTASYDPMRLDGIKVDDGIACESLP